MPLIKDDHMVETLTSNGADHPFDKWILPRGARCGKDLLDPETVDATIEVRSVGLVSVPYQVPRRRVPWKSIDHLLRRPLGGRMFGDIEMNDTATLVAKDDEDEQNAEGCGRQSEKVERHQVRLLVTPPAKAAPRRFVTLKALIVTTPAELREQLDVLTDKILINRCANLSPGAGASTTASAKHSRAWSRTKPCPWLTPCGCAQAANFSQ